MRTIFAVAAIFLTGCAIQAPHPTRPCPGKKSAAEAIETLNLRREKILPIRATGQCLLRYRLDGKQHKENFPVKLWINPPDEIYLQGDVAFDAAGLVFGANADEFWFWLKPKEISSYWWGSWSQADNWDNLALSPKAVLEVFGSVDIQDGDWSLARIGNFDVLILNSEQGVVLKRVYIEPCDYVVSKIEYLDSAGIIIGLAEFAEYQQVNEGFLAPTSIKITAFANNKGNDSARITLASVKPTQFSEQQRHRLFVRPQPRGFDHVYKIIDGAAIEHKTE